MNIVFNIPAFSILFLIFTGVVCMVLHGKWAELAADFAMLLVTIFSLDLFIYFLRGGEVFTYSMGHFGAPFGNELRAGILEAGLAVLFSAVCLLSHMGGRKHLHDDIPDSKTNLYCISLIFLLCSMLALDYSNDLFTVYVFIEINTITACAIIMAKDNGYTHAATITYLILSLLGSGMFLLGVSIIYGITGHLLMTPISEYLAVIPQGSNSMKACYGAVALFTVGLSLKSALWPFSFWLPEAHASASATSSAVLSGLVLKAYILSLLKVLIRVVGLDILTASHIADLILIVGCMAMIAGSVHAIFEKDIKKVLAYSSIGQIGYIFCAIGMCTHAGMVAAIVQIVVHAVTKSMLFISASEFIEACDWKRDYPLMEGIARRCPLSALAFVIGSLSMIGLPLFAGFATKYTLVGAAVELSGWKEIIAVIAIIISTVLTAIYYIKIIAVLYKTEGHKERFLATGPELKISVAVFIIINFAVGLNIDGLVSVIENGLRTFG